MILIPENEDRTFKYGILPNKLKYTIIYDKHSDTSNVVMSVKTGSLYEPLEFMGLAHFLEHMLFMGSRKYKDEDYFSTKLKEYGGSSNAYTDNYHTVYYFDVISNNLENIIDIFSRFFIDPLFDINSVSREINAVNSEHLKNYNNDFWILRQLILNLTDKKHIANRFSTGSHETLGRDIHKVRDAMIKFYNTYYFANNMTLTIQSNKPIKDIEKIIKNSFGSIKNKKVSHPIVPIKKFNSFNNEYQLQTVRDSDSIIYFWECEEFNEYKDNKIIDIISNAIELNCKNNLQNKLIETQLVSNIDISYFDVGIFILNVDMNPNINYKKAIVIINNMIRDYFNNLKNISENISWNKIYDYYCKSYELNYNNRIKEDNMNLATNISNNMHYYDEPNVYNGSKLIIKKDYNKLYKTLELFIFDKVNIIYGTKKKLHSSNECKLIKDKYYGKYYCKLNKTYIINNNNNNNNYNINIDETILNINPKVIKNLDKYNKIRKLSPRFWYGGVSKFNEPIVLGHIIIYNKLFFNSPLSSLISQIAIGIINYKMQLLFCNEIDIGYRVYLSFNNIIGFISLNISGFNDKYVDFFNKVIDNIKIDASDVMIENDISLYKKELNNMDKESPWDISSHILQSMLHKYVYYYKDELKEINKITVDMVKQRINKIITLNKLSLTTIIYGNINYKELKNCNTYKMNIPLNNIILKTHMPKNITLQHPNKDEVNCCISFIYPINNNNNSLLSAKLIILSTLMGRPAFDELRTKAQLGYLVSCKLKIEKLSYIKLSVQSALDYKKVEELMNVFIDKQFIDILENIDEKTFNQTKKSIYDNLIEKDNNLAEMAQSYISEITSQEYIFDREIRIAKKLKEVSLNDIIKLYHSIIKNKTIIRVI
jgi:insulysin